MTSHHYKVARTIQIRINSTSNICILNIQTKTSMKGATKMTRCENETQEEKHYDMQGMNGFGQFAIVDDVFDCIHCVRDTFRD